MIVKMSRVYIAARLADRDRLLDRLGPMNLLHLEPVKPEEAVADQETLRAIADLDRAIQILAPFEPAWRTPSQKPFDAARETIEIRMTIKDLQDRLADLHRGIEALAVWGNVRISEIEGLRESGLEVRFFSVPQGDIDKIRAECAEIVSMLPAKRVLMAVIDRSAPFDMPESADPVPLPTQDRPSVLAEAAKIDADLKQRYKRLSELAGLIEALREERARLVSEVGYVTAQRSGLSQGELFAVQGWLPSEEARNLRSRLSGYEIHTAVRIRPAGKDETPPTKIQYPLWARPMMGLFDILGTLPGYREMDLSPFFMLALPAFAAMLIGDAGYGFLISLAGILFYRRLSRVAGRPKAQIVIIFGLVTLLWGVLTANYFGVTPDTLSKTGALAASAEPGAGVAGDALFPGTGLYSRAAKIMRWAAPLWRPDPEAARFLIIKVSLIIGCLHLIVARLRKMIELVPDQRALAELGWIVALADMLVVVWHLLFVGVNRVPSAVWWVLAAAVLLSSWFGRPSGNPAKRLLLGLASSLLPLLSTFSDTMSYVRLFAVGLASYYIASAFNALSVQIAGAATWFAAVPVLIFGHGLNLGLATIAIFAHGVRLNMLEFSNNAGVQWGGYAYRPFSTGNGITSEKDTL